MVEIYMTLEGTPAAQRVVLDLIVSMYGELMEAGTTDSGASLWVVETRTSFRNATVTRASPGSGSIHAELEDLVGLCGRDPDRIHELIHGRMVCTAAEELSLGGIAFFAEPEHLLRALVARSWPTAA